MAARHGPCDQVTSHRPGHLRRCSISRWILSSVTGSRSKASHAFAATPIPQPAIGKMGQKKPAQVKNQIMTRKALTAR
jgi:hypothetical protein